MITLFGKRDELSQQLCKVASKGTVDDGLIEDEFLIESYIVRALVLYGADVHVADDEKKTPLHHAAAKGKLDIIEYLLQQGARVDRVDRYSNFQ